MAGSLSVITRQVKYQAGRASANLEQIQIQQRQFGVEARQFGQLD